MEEEVLEIKLFEARGFYAIIMFATPGSVALYFTPIDPNKAVFTSGVSKGRAAAATAPVAGHPGDFQRRSR